MSNISENNLLYVTNHQLIVIGEIQTAYGFYRFYFANLHLYPNQETCFQYCNQYFKNQFGYYRYPDYRLFKGGSCPQLQSEETVKLNVTKESLEREFLITHFKMCGFDTWTSFKAVVLHYFPEVTEVKLLEFWQNTAIDSHVLIRVNHVKQILG